MRCGRADVSVIDPVMSQTGGNGKVSRSDGISGVARNAGRYSASREHRGCEVEHKPETKTLRRRGRLSGGITHVVQQTRRRVICNTTERRVGRPTVVNDAAATTRQRCDGVSSERIIDANTYSATRGEAQALSRPRGEIAAGPSTFVGDGTSLHGYEVRVVVAGRLGESLKESSRTRS